MIRLYKKQFNCENNPSVIKLIWEAFVRRKIMLFSLALILITLPILYLVYKYKPKAEAAWWDETWLYRKAVQVTNNTSTQNNVYISLTINTSDTSKFQSDCGDLRFTKQSGELLDYYIVSGCGTSSTLIHVNFDIFPSGSQTIYYYYGNPSAPNGFSTSDFSTEASNYTIGSTSSEEQSPGPVAYWKFDEGTGTTVYDSTANGNNGTISGATWQTEDMCVVGKCLSFDGTDDVVTVSNSVANIKTVSFWVKPITTSEQFIDLNGSAYIQASSGTISATGFTNPTIYVNGKVSTTIEANKWQHVVVTTNTAVSGSAVKIAQISSNFGQVFVDEVKLYPYARSAAQIKADYNAGKAKAASSKGVAVNLGAPKDASAGLPSSLSEGLVGYWKMDESSWTNDCSTLTVIDSSGNGNHGKSCPAGAGSQPTTGKFGNAGNFDGNNDYVTASFPTRSTTTIKSETLAAWVYRSGSGPGSYSGIVHIMGTGDNNHQSGIATDETFSNVLCSGIYDSGFLATNSTPLPSGQWIHVVCTFEYVNGTITIKIFKNGQYAGSVSNQASTYQYNSGNINIGVQKISHSRYFYGKIDEVRIYNRALSPAEVRALYEWAPGPVAHFKLDDGSGNSPIDSSGFSRTGSIINGIWSIGKFGKGLKLDGSGDYLEISDF